MDPERPSSADAYRQTDPLPGEPEALFSARVTPGQLIAGRFQVERLAGAGGMAVVYRAKDLSNDSPVALKVMGKRRLSGEERFAREARLLAQITHPAVVRYVAHGVTESGAPYLAMEWLTGEDLAARLARSGLTVEETLSLMRRICAGLAVVHQKGMTHRDITPGNLFLVDGRADAAKLLDFGVARQQGGARTLTMAGTALGTVGYMAPEQAMGLSDVDARADVFALGCVLFECLTGSPAFSGVQDIAVLAKVLRDDVPRITELRPDLDPNLDTLVNGMLAKDREQRPRDASVLLAALEQLGELRGAATPNIRRLANARLVESEQRIASVVIARPERPEPATLASAHSDVEAAQLEDLVQRFGAQPIPLRGGRLLLVFGGVTGTIATDQAVQAVRCALRLRSLRPQLEIGVATGGLERAFNASVGLAIDRAAHLLERASLAPSGVRIDELTAGLIGARFDVERRTGSGFQVLSGVEREERPRLLLGEPSPCVGRDKELALLDATLTECREDRVARALVVSAQPGVGKSRLGREFLERVRAQEGAVAFLAHADPISTRSALNLVQRLLHHALGLREGDPAEARRERLQTRLERVPDPARREFLREFLGELLGLPVRDPSPLLKAARNDPTVLREQTRRALELWLRAELAEHAVVLLLEDLQWADVPSVNYLEETLRALADQPIFLLALARPEVHEHFPELFRSLGAQEVRLLGLTKRAAERLARQVLPASVDPAIVDRIVELADGNAFYLEELIRHVAEGGSELPETVRAIVQSRLEGLDASARRHLRAASVFGETCWLGGVIALLGSPGEVASWFERLTREEIFVRRPNARYPGEVEYVFRHALLRDAAYAMLTEADRRDAHELAGEWLEAIGERDPAVLANHFERGAAPQRAQPWLLLAARGALFRDDFPGAIALAQRGLTLGAQGRERGELLLVEAHASAWATRTHLELAREAFELLPAASGPWWFALALLVFGSSASGRSELAKPYLELAAISEPPQDQQHGAFGQGFEVLALGAVLLGHIELGWSMLRKFEQWVSHAGDYVSEAWFNTTACQLYTNSLHEGVWRLERAVQAGRAAVEGMRTAGAVSGEATALLHLGIALRELGRYAEAEQLFRESAQKATRVKNVLVAEFSRMMLAVFALRAGERDQGVTQLEQLASSKDANLVQACTVVRAEVLLRGGNSIQALEFAREALLGPGLMHRTAAAVTLARAELANGRAQEALRVLQRARAARGPDAFPQLELDLLSTSQRALTMLGELDRAQEVAHELGAFAARTLSAIVDPDLRVSFEKRVQWSRR